MPGKMDSPCTYPRINTRGYLQREQQVTEVAQIARAAKIELNVIKYSAARCRDQSAYANSYDLAALAENRREGTFESAISAGFHICNLPFLMPVHNVYLVVLEIW
jgi:hypothetical protein